MNKERAIELGNIVEDTVTGFVGIATSRVEYLNGCIQYNVKGKVENNKIPDSQYIDVEQLKFLRKGVQRKLTNPTGGDMPDSPFGDNRH